MFLGTIPFIATRAGEPVNPGDNPYRLTMVLIAFLFFTGFWSGYGVVTDPHSTRHRIVARSILKYAKLLPEYLGDLPGPVPASWPQAAERFTLIP